VGRLQGDVDALVGQHLAHLVADGDPGHPLNHHPVLGPAMVELQAPDAKPAWDTATGSTARSGCPNRRPG
jgi:hypothetical protein